ncbi:MAG: hypothetical protein Q9224_001156, partial [Gallowayella concinna]
MLSFLSLSVQALVLLSLCTGSFGREREFRAKRLEVERDQTVDKRGVCYEDDTFESFKYWLEDSAPYCSSLLGLSDFTRTVPSLSRTTTSPLSTTYITRTATATVPAVTIFATSFLPIVAKRADDITTAAPGFYEDNPYAYPVYAGDAPNASIAASYYSACSCLSLKPSTVQAVSVDITTRTIAGLDTEETTSFVYVTTGTTTQTLTRQGNLGTSTTLSTVSVVPLPPSGTAPSVTAPIGTASISVLPSLPSFNASITLSNTFASSGTRPNIVVIVTTQNLTAISVPSQAPTISINATTLLPTVTGPSSGFIPPSSANASFSILPSSGFAPISTGVTGPSSGFIPPSSANASFSIRPSSGFAPISTGNLNFSLGTTGFPTASVNSSRPISAFPTLTSNLTSFSYGFPTPSANSSITSQASLTIPAPSANLSISTRPTLGFPSLSVNSTSSTRASSGFLPSSGNLSSFIPATGYPTYPASFSTIIVTVTDQSTSTLTISSVLPLYPDASNTSSVISIPVPSTTVAVSKTNVSPTDPALDPATCPGLDGTIIALPDGQQFAVVCETQYGGPVDVGISEKSFSDCVQDCGTANNGFSAVRCRGVTYFPNLAPPLQNCFFKNLASLAEAYHNLDVISAVLLSIPILSVTIPAPTSFPAPTATS